jgi:colanic acid biosynthesis protein WcaH
MLSSEEFKQLIQIAPLVSIDIIIKTRESPKTQPKYLLGLRNNEPAKGMYFTLGGRVRKNEKLAEAFSRISKAELGFEINFQDADFNKITEHFYDTNYFEDDNSTHYINLSYVYELPNKFLDCIKNDSQHNTFVWLTNDEIFSNDRVHKIAQNLFL